MRFFADDAELGTVPLDDIASCDRLGPALERLGGWGLRPRALALTIWARLLVADLFIHGIGGAKYDRIADTIIHDYYGTDAPQMVCASATLQFARLPRAASGESVGRLRQELRDLQYNPQRHVAREGGLRDLFDARARAVQASEELRLTAPRGREARRRAFRDIRKATSQILARCEDTVESMREEVAAAIRSERAARLARGREYFFALYDRADVEALLRALPQERSFRV